MIAPVEVLISELQCRILVEVYLAHGPVDIFRLWSEMFERQKSISSGMLLFTRAIVQLEDEGYLQKVGEMSSTLAPKGEMHLIGAVLSGELPEGCWEKLSSTQNIFDVADQASGNAPLTDGFQVGYEGVSGIAEGREVDTRAGSYTRDRVSPSSVGSETTQVSGCMTSENQASPADSQFQGTTIDELLALVASKLPDISLSRQHELEEIEAEREGQWGDSDSASEMFHSQHGDGSRYR